jgi:hypothetical protein
MKKTILVLTLTLFLIACSQQAPTVENYRIGSEGVSVEFVKNMPPESIRQGQDVFLGINLWNRGAFDVETGFVTLNYDTLYFNEIDSSQEDEPYFFDIKGKGPGYSTGGRLFLDLNRLKTQELPGQINTRETTISANICYPYETLLADNFCLDRDIFETEENPTCRNTPVKTYPGQGGPVIITKIETEMLPVGSITETVGVNREVLVDGGFTGLEEGEEELEIYLLRPEFEITIENRGSGRVYLKEESDIGRFVLNCGDNNNNIAIMENSVATITCTITPDNLESIGIGSDEFEDLDVFILANNYVEILNLKLEYMYIDEVSKRVSIRR